MENENELSVAWANATDENRWNGRVNEEDGAKIGAVESRL